jgi:adenosylcobinamide-GDP ribazoletransferase
MQLSEHPPRPRPPLQDNGPPRPPEPEAPRQWRMSDDLVMCLRFFSRLPTGDRPFEAPDLGRMALALPFASVVIGLGPAVLMVVLVLLGVPPWFAAGMGVLAMILVTGAMPDDAVADAVDGLFGGHSVERRLEIMKDSRHGSYGVAALTLYIVLRVAAIGGVATVNPYAAAAIWIAATILARSGSLWLTHELPPARSGGASAAVGQVGLRPWLVGAGFAAVIAFVLAAPATSLLAVVLALIATAAIAKGWSRLCRRLVGGQTGDLIGALHVLIEIGVLTVLLIFA